MKSILGSQLLPASHDMLESCCQQRKSGHYILHAKRNSWGLYAGILIQGLMLPHNSYACINTSKFSLIMTKDEIPSNSNFVESIASFIFNWMLSTFSDLLSHLWLVEKIILPILSLSFLHISLVSSTKTI